VGLMRKLFGKSYRSKGAVPEHHCKASGGLIRHILIQLESCGLVEKMDEAGSRKISSAVCDAPAHALLHLHNFVSSHAKLLQFKA
jgi:ribosomal protein S19E (S16A)